MANKGKDFNPQQQDSRPPQIDESAEQKHKAEQEEIAGRHKNDAQNDHQGNRRQPGTHRGG